MPIFNLTRGGNSGIRVIKADNYPARVTGLAGLGKFDRNSSFLLPSCSSVHTFGMKYPIDVLFLDRDNVVIKKIHALGRNRAAGAFSAAQSVLELHIESTGAKNIHLGDQLHLEIDEHHRPGFSALKAVLRWPVNILLAAFWGCSALIGAGKWLEYGGLVSAGLIVVNTIIFLLFLTRRETQETSNNISDWLAALFTVLFSFSLRPHAAALPGMQALSVFVQFAGILGILISIVSLGRSFGLIPANRKIKTAGAYRLVRHPLYVSEMVFYTGFLMGNYSPLNLLFVCLIFAGQIYRSHAEEKLLSKDQGYRFYRSSVRFRFVPGIY